MDLFNSKIFLDSGDPKETEEAYNLLGFLDGQTTNPTLISKNPEIQKILKENKKLSKEDLLEFYKDTIKKIESIIPNGLISIEVYSDKNTAVDDMVSQGKEMANWCKNSYIKLPTTKDGIIAAQKLVSEGINVNMTLCFSQEQAASVHCAAKNAKEWQVLVSPFIGRLDDKGINGISLIKNIILMYRKAQSNVKVLAASIRNLNHLLASIKYGCNIATCPLKVIKEWSSVNMELPDDNFEYKPKGLSDIGYKELDLSKSWEDFNINNELTDAGLEKFANDWNSIIK